MPVASQVSEVDILSVCIKELYSLHVRECACMLKQAKKEMPMDKTFP